MDHFDPREPHDITALCILEGAEHLSAERVTTFDFKNTYATAASYMDAGYTTNESIMITDTYVLTNNSTNDLSIPVFYPITYFSDSDEFGMWVDQRRCSNRWGARSQVEFDADVSNHKVQAYLADGTYFEKAFPDWPTLGTPKEQPETPPESDVLSWRYKVAFYLENITIRAGEQITIQVSYLADYASALRFSPTFGSINCNSHALEIKNAGGIKVLEENLGLPSPLAACSIDLDSQKTNYQMTFTVAPPT